MAPGIASTTSQCASTGVGGQGKNNIPTTSDERGVLASARVINLRYLITITYIYAILAIKEWAAVDGQAFDDGVGRRSSWV